MIKEIVNTNLSKETYLEGGLNLISKMQETF